MKFAPYKEIFNEILAWREISRCSKDTKLKDPMDQLVNRHYIIDIV